VSQTVFLNCLKAILLPYTDAMGVKKNAKALVESLADNATWEELIYQIDVQEAIDRGLEASAAGRVHDSASALQKLGLSEPPQIH
jgi:hypothetical protein